MNPRWKYFRRRLKHAVRPVQHRLEYAGLLAVEAILSRLPLRAARWLCGAVAGLIGWVPFGPGRVALENIRRAFDGTMSRRRARRLSIEHFRHLGWMAADLTHGSSFRMAPENHIHMSGQEHYWEAKHRAGSVFVLAFHCASWEWMAQYHALTLGRINILVKDQANPWVNRWIQKQRAAAGIHNMPVRNAATKILRALKSGEDVGFVFDQHARARDGIVVPFFGRPASTARGLALMAIKTGTPVVPTAAWWTPEGKVEGAYYPEIPPVLTGDTDRDIEATTLAYNRFLEARIREHPADWLWSHRRWRA